MFKAEDPVMFARRVSEAFFNRKKTENVLRLVVVEGRLLCGGID